MLLKKKRMRKLKKLLEEEGRGLANASVNSSQGSCTDGDARVPVVCLLDGRQLTGDEAPTHSQLGAWLLEHPEYAPCDEILVRHLLSRQIVAFGFGFCSF